MNIEITASESIVAFRGFQRLNSDLVREHCVPRVNFNGQRLLNI